MGKLIAVVLMVITIILWIYFAMSYVEVRVPLFGNALQILWFLKIKYSK